MPAPAVTSEPVLPVRELEADEEYVMNAFEGHVSRCDPCKAILRVEPEDRSLCNRGQQYARDVTAYLYSKNKNAYSAVDRDFNQPTLVKIPIDCKATRHLLMAIEDGFHLLHRKEEAAQKPVSREEPVISYDRTYYVPPRRSHTVTEIIEREPRTLTGRPRAVIVYPSPNRGSPSRGSLYDSDVAERVERVKESSRIYRPVEHYR
ncbi:hypothetical protein BJX61DRAFT_375516 [Aspergillus egyptiacus]|nr:hypothetical protein BJX61DRAFT_375516 [Aspergillus egyptiacus]